MMKCRVCGCTFYEPCVDEYFGPCGWWLPGLCTLCVRRIRNAVGRGAAFAGGVALIAFASFWLWTSAP